VDKTAAASNLMGLFASRMEKERTREREGKNENDGKPPGTVILNVILDPNQDRTGGLFIEQAREMVYGDKSKLMEDLQIISTTKDMANFTKAVEKMCKQLRFRGRECAAQGDMLAAYKMEREAAGLAVQFKHMDHAYNGMVSQGTSAREAFTFITEEKRSELRGDAEEGSGMFKRSTFDMMSAMINNPAKKPKYEQPADAYGMPLYSGLPQPPPAPTLQLPAPPPYPQLGAPGVVKPKGTGLRDSGKGQPLPGGLAERAKRAGWLGVDHTNGTITAEAGQCWKCLQLGHESINCNDPRWL
jgi:hypothetical protein